SKEINAEGEKAWQSLSPERRQEAVVATLRRVECLIIWDGVEVVNGYPHGAPSDYTMAARKCLREFLSRLQGGRGKILLTSCREEPWLSQLCHSIPLGGLAL